MSARGPEDPFGDGWAVLALVAFGVAAVLILLVAFR